MPGPFGRQQYVMLPEDELRAQQEQQMQQAAPMEAPKPSYTGDFLGFLQGLTKQQEAAQSQYDAQMAPERAGAQEQDAAQKFANMMMAGGASMLGRPDVSTQHMQLAQQNNAQNALQLKDKNFQEWLAKRFDIGKQSGEYNQAKYHDLMSEQNMANLAQSKSRDARSAAEFGRTEQLRRDQMAMDAREAANNRFLRKLELDTQNQQRLDARNDINRFRQEELDIKKQELERKIAEGQVPKAGNARAAGAASLLPEGYEFRDPAAASFVTPAQVGEMQKILALKNKIKTVTGQLNELATKEGGRAFFGENAALAKSKYEDLMLTLKEAKNLGVLQKIDVEHLSEFVPNPIEYKPSLKNPSSFGSDMKKLNAFIGELEPQFDSEMQARGLQRKQAPSQTVAPQAALLPQSPDDMVRVIHPDGRTGSIPKSKLEAAVKAGFKVTP